MTEEDAVVACLYYKLSIARVAGIMNMRDALTADVEIP